MRVEKTVIIRSRAVDLAEALIWSRDRPPDAEANFCAALETEAMAA